MCFSNITETCIVTLVDTNHSYKQTTKTYHTGKRHNPLENNGSGTVTTKTFIYQNSLFSYLDWFAMRLAKIFSEDTMNYF